MSTVHESSVIVDNLNQDDVGEEFEEELEVSGSEDEEEVEEIEKVEEIPLGDAALLPPSTQVSTPSQKSQVAPVVKSGAAVKTTPRGKVVPSPEVASLDLTRGSGSNPAVNRLVDGNWNEKSFNSVNIVFPLLSSKDETTNELTRKNSPEKRFWKGTISFVDGLHTRNTIVIRGVGIPYHDNPKYGLDFVYLALPGYMAAHFAECGMKRRPTVANEKNLVADPNRWWKIANKVSDRFGIANPVKKTFERVALPTLFTSTNKGIICNVELRFLNKASTENEQSLTATVPQTIAVEVIRGYIVTTDVDIQGPTRIARNTETVKPSYSAADFATDTVMQRLASLGLRC